MSCERLYDFMRSWELRASSQLTADSSQFVAPLAARSCKAGSSQLQYCDWWSKAPSRYAEKPYGLSVEMVNFRYAL
jgi:hypothetical protein